MTRKSEPAELPTSGSRYMTLQQVADELGFKSRGSIYNLICSGALAGVPVGTTGRGIRVTRKSFEDYCARIEADGAKRFQPAS